LPFAAKGNLTRLLAYVSFKYVLSCSLWATFCVALFYFFAFCLLVDLDRLSLASTSASDWKDLSPK